MADARLSLCGGCQLGLHLLQLRCLALNLGADTVAGAAVLLQRRQLRHGIVQNALQDAKP